MPIWRVFCTAAMASVDAMPNAIAMSTNVWIMYDDADWLTWMLTCAAEPIVVSSEAALKAHDDGAHEDLRGDANRDARDDERGLNSTRSEEAPCDAKREHRLTRPIASRAAREARARRQDVGAGRTMYPLHRATCAQGSFRIP